MSSNEQLLEIVSQMDEDEEDEEEEDISLEFVDLPKLESNLNKRMKSLRESKKFVEPIFVLCAHVC